MPPGTNAIHTGQIYTDTTPGIQQTRLETMKQAIPWAQYQVKLL